MIVYGLKSCDSCRKALKALEAAGHRPRLHDVRAAPLSPEDIARFHASLGAGLLNRASATWRGLSGADRTLPPEQLLAAHPALMKRPVIEAGGRLYLGWSADVRASLLN